MKCKTAKVIKASEKQVGKSVQSRDKKRKALKPGKRVSRDGNIYYERRKNRSDRKGKTVKAFCKPRK